MINYLAHWEQILIQSRSSIVSELKEYNFNAICPIKNNSELENVYHNLTHWELDRTKLLDVKGIISLRKILKNTDKNSTFHIFTLKSGFLFMISSIFINRNFKSTLSITGLGFLFSKTLKSNLLKYLSKIIFMFFINKTFENIIFQNETDKNIFLKYSKFKNNALIIESSGLKIDEFKPKTTINKNLKILFAGRLLYDKGIVEYIDFANLCNEENLEFYLAGNFDFGNPRAISKFDFEKMIKNSNVEFLGHISSSNSLKDYDVLISLSEHEGFSRILLEAAYVGLYCIAKENNGTKFLSQFENASLLDSTDPKLIKKEINKVEAGFKFISEKNKKIISEKFTIEYVASQFQKIYN